MTNRSTSNSNQTLAQTDSHRPSPIRYVVISPINAIFSQLLSGASSQGHAILSTFMHRLSVLARSFRLTFLVRFPCNVRLLFLTLCTSCARSLIAWLRVRVRILFQPFLQQSQNQDWARRSRFFARIPSGLHEPMIFSRREMKGWRVCRMETPIVVYSLLNTSGHEIRYARNPYLDRWP